MARTPLPTRFCDHCGLPVGAASHERVVEGAPRSFCCVGCSIAWRLAGAGGSAGGGGEASSFLARIGLGFVLSMIVMLIAWVPYLDPSAATDEYKSFAPWAVLIAATPVLLVLGIPYLWNARSRSGGAASAPTCSSGSGSRPPTAPPSSGSRPAVPRSPSSTPRRGSRRS